MSNPSHPAGENSPGLPPGFFSRRKFLRSSALVGTAAGMAGCWLREGEIYRRPPLTEPQRYLPPGAGPRIAIVGCGEAARILMSAIERIEDPMMMPRIVAVADVDRTRVFELAGRANASGHPALGYPTLDELLAAHGKELDAVIIATPDFLHHEQTIRCLRAGLHVYCEDPMSNRIEWAREMVKAAKETGKLLQIGSHRRSHPRYMDLRDRVIAENHALGVLQHTTARQYLSPYALTPFAARGSRIRDAAAKENGYGSYFEMRNWRFFRNFGLGMVGWTVAFLDTLNSTLQSAPRRIVALGDAAFLEKGIIPEHPGLTKPGKVIAQFEYDLPPHLHSRGEAGVVSATLELIGGHSFSRAFESFHGELAAVEISDRFSTNRIDRRNRSFSGFEQGKKILDGDLDGAPSDPASREYLVRQYLQDKGWKNLLRRGVIEIIPSNDSHSARKPWESPRPNRRRQPYELTALELLEDDRNPGRRPMLARNIEPSEDQSEYRLAKTRELPPGQAHLLNFFHAIRSGKAEDLRCPPEEGFRTCVTAIKLLESMESGKPVELTPDDFAV
jgi:predicted dehydrogenase